MHHTLMRLFIVGIPQFSTITIWRLLKKKTLKNVYQHTLIKEEDVILILLLKLLIACCFLS